MKTIQVQDLEDKLSNKRIKKRKMKVTGKGAFKLKKIIEKKYVKNEHTYCEICKQKEKIQRPKKKKRKAKEKINGN